MQGLSIGKLACAANVSADTIRFYERQGLLSRPERRKSGYRLYTEQHLSELIAIRQARSLGFTLGEIAELLALRTSDDPAKVRVVIERKLESIDRTMTQLERWRSVLACLLHTEIEKGGSERSLVLEQLKRAALIDPPDEPRDS